MLSFNGNKIMTTSGGGMLLTDDADLAAHVRKLSTQAREPVAHYEHTEVGYNYRLSNILAALGPRPAEPARRHDQAAPGVARALSRAGRRPARRAASSAARTTPRTTAGSPRSSSTRRVTGWTAADLARGDGRGRHRDPAGVEADAPAAGLRRLSGTLDGTSERLFDQGLTLPSGSAMTDEEFARVESVIRVGGGAR